jgi:multidrug efflux pump subunit AcrA (membrane-fusion protein)
MDAIYLLLDVQEGVSGWLAIRRLKEERDAAQAELAKTQAWFREAESMRDYWKNREQKRTAALKAQRDAAQAELAQAREALERAEDELQEGLVMANTPASWARFLDRMGAALAGREEQE